MTVLDKAKVDCLSAFALNSLVWMWLRTKGVNPKESEVCVYLKNEMRMSNSNQKIHRLFGMIKSFFSLKQLNVSN